MCGLKKAMAMAVAASGLFYAQAQQWQNLYPSYSGLAFGGGKFVAVSEDGLILTGDGTEWSSDHFAPAGSSLYSAAHDGDRFIAMQGNSYVHYSADGALWVQSTTGLSATCRYLTSGGGDLIGISDEGETFLYDHVDDGWSSTYSRTSSELYHAAYGAGRFVAVGSNIVSSADGKGWAQRNSGGANVVAFNGERFVAVAANGSTVYTSEDGNVWSSAPSDAPAGLKDMTFGGGKFVAVGGGRAAASVDGLSWTPSTLDAGDNFRAVKHGNGMFVALGARGSLYTSVDGASWTRRANGRTISYKQIVYSGTLFVAVGDSGVSVSSDGRSWNAKECGKGLQSVAYGGGKFVAVGDSGAIWTSPDGETWTDKSPPGSANHSTMFTSVAFGDDRFVVGGKAATGVLGGVSIFTSANGGETWTDVSGIYWSPTSLYPTTLCYGNDKFLAAGHQNGTLKSSNDGEYWSDVTLPDDAQSHAIVSITHVGTGFVALGVVSNNPAASAILLTSADGVSWTTVTTNAPARAKSATYAKGYYLVAADSGNIYGSQDGQNWQRHKKVTNRNLSTIYFGNNVLLAAGASGAMLYLPGDRISVRHTPASNRSQRYAYGMSVDNARKAPVVTLSFTPDKPGTIAVYSLTGKQLYKKRVGAGERTISLPRRVAANGSVIVRYSGDGRTVAKRFQMVK